MQTEDRACRLRTELLSSGNFRVLVGVTGSVAALKLPLLVSELLQLPGVCWREQPEPLNLAPYIHSLKFCSAAISGSVLTRNTGHVFSLKVDVRVVSTEHAKHFYDTTEVSVRVYGDQDEWELWTQRSDPVLHIELRRWADLLLIAPLDANTLGKISSGLCDNLLTCVVRAWDCSRPLLFCPAMNTAMWQHPITAQQVSRLLEFGYVEVPCIAKKLVCGDEGKGAMAEVSTIVNVVKQYLPTTDQ